jgi:hypothetical protein
VIAENYLLASSAKKPLAVLNLPGNFMVLPFFFPAYLDFRIAGPEGGEEPAGKMSSA